MRAVDLAVQARQHRVESWARTVVFWAHVTSGDLEASARAADALVYAARANGEPEGQAFGRTSQGRLSLLRGDLTTARGLFAEAAALSREKAAYWARADALSCLCSTTMALGEVSASLQILEEALLFFVPLRFAGTDVLFGALAKLLADAGHRDRALQVLSVVPATFDSAGHVALMRATHGQPRARDARGAHHVGRCADGRGRCEPDLDAALRIALDSPMVR